MFGLGKKKKVNEEQVVQQKPNVPIDPTLKLQLAAQEAQKKISQINSVRLPENPQPTPIINKMPIAGSNQPNVAATHNVNQINATANQQVSAQNQQEIQAPHVDQTAAEPVPKTTLQNSVQTQTVSNQASNTMNAAGSQVVRPLVQPDYSAEDIPESDSQYVQAQQYQEPIYQPQPYSVQNYQQEQYQLSLEERLKSKPIFEKLKNNPVLWLGVIGISVAIYIVMIIL